MWVVLQEDCYMGDGDYTPCFGIAGIDNIFGPFASQADAEAFSHRANAAKSFATDFRVREMTMELPEYIEAQIPKRYKPKKVK